MTRPRSYRRVLCEKCRKKYSYYHFPKHSCKPRTERKRPADLNRSGGKKNG